MEETLDSESVTEKNWTDAVCFVLWRILDWRLFASFMQDRSYHPFIML